MVTKSHVKEESKSKFIRVSISTWKIIKNHIRAGETFDQTLRKLLAHADSTPVPNKPTRKSV